MGNRSPHSRQRTHYLATPYNRYAHASDRDELRAYNQRARENPKSLEEKRAELVEQYRECLFGHLGEKLTPAQFLDMANRRDRLWLVIVDADGEHSTDFSVSPVDLATHKPGEDGQVEALFLEAEPARKFATAKAREIKQRHLPPAPDDSE